MTTVETLTEAQILALRDEALQHGDVAMAVICDVASGGPEAIRDAHYATLPADLRAHLEAMDRDAARAKVVAALNYAEAQS